MDGCQWSRQARGMIVRCCVGCKSREEKYPAAAIGIQIRARFVIGSTVVVLPNRAPNLPIDICSGIVCKSGFSTDVSNLYSGVESMSNSLLWQGRHAGRMRLSCYADLTNNTTSRA